MRNHLAWYGALPALPLLAAQGWWARRRALRLPAAAGPARGQIDGPGPALRLALLGESPVAGVGVRSHAEGLAGQSARALAAASGRPVSWLAAGENGIRLDDCRARLAPRVRAFSPDALIVVLGVNDTTALTPRARWRDGYRRLLADLDGRCTVVCAGLPPMRSFWAVPQPLREVIGARAALLDADLQTLCAARPATAYLGLTRPLANEELAEDGYHPSALGCARWGAQLSRALLDAGAISTDPAGSG